MGQSISEDVREKIHELYQNSMESITNGINEDSTSEWYRLARNLGITANNRHIQIYQQFERHVSLITNGNYSRIRKYEQLDDEGKRLLQLILDSERLQNEQEQIEIQREEMNDIREEERNIVNISNTTLIGVGSVLGACVVYGGIKYYISKHVVSH